MKPHIQAQYLEVYEANAEAIYRHCFFRVFSKQLAEELMQEAFMKTWEYLQDGHEVENLRAFLYKVANNLIIDYARKKKEQSLERVMEEHPGFEPSDSDEKDMERALLLKEVREAIERLPEEQRQLLIMRYIDDLDPKDIAHVLDITPNHVSVKLNRAMQQLKEQFHA
jgi:RNA polymerase sigma-70 factor (ECF subfamily)